MMQHRHSRVGDFCSPPSVIRFAADKAGASEVSQFGDSDHAAVIHGEKCRTAMKKLIILIYLQFGFRKKPRASHC